LGLFFLLFGAGKLLDQTKGTSNFAVMSSKKVLDAFEYQRLRLNEAFAPAHAKFQ